MSDKKDVVACLVVRNWNNRLHAFSKSKGRTLCGRTPAFDAKFLEDLPLPQWPRPRELVGYEMCKTCVAASHPESP